AARYRKITFASGLEGAPTITGDEKMVRRAVVNLLWNAMKVSPPGSAVGLTCERSDGRVRIAISDQGQAIPAEERTKILDQYFQAEASRKNRALGIGYGLVYCRLVAESHGGSLTVEAAEKGNRFVLSLPV